MSVHGNTYYSFFKMTQTNYLYKLVLVGVLNCLVLATTIQCSENHERPCGSSDIDAQCVREFFKENGDGEVVTDPDDEPVLRDRYVSYFPQLNTTVVDTDTLLFGLDGQIENFYINRDTGKLVFSVFFEKCSFYTPEGYFYFTRRGQEPLTRIAFIRATYPPVSLTAIMPLINGRVTQESLRQGTVTFVLLSSDFPMELGPEVQESEEPVIIKVLAGKMADIYTGIQEIFHTAGPGVFLAYFQKYISNYNIPLNEIAMVTPLPGRPSTN